MRVQRHHQQKHRYQTLMGRNGRSWPAAGSTDASIATSNHHWAKSECEKLIEDRCHPDTSEVRHVPG